MNDNDNNALFVCVEQAACKVVHLIVLCCVVLCLLRLLGSIEKSDCKCCEGGSTAVATVSVMHCEQVKKELLLTVVSCIVDEYRDAPRSGSAGDIAQNGAAGGSANLMNQMLSAQQIGTKTSRERG